MINKVPLTELQTRLERFRIKMDNSNPDWEIVILINKINLYYFTGTMTEGILIIPKNDEACLWVRRSFERAQDESLFPNIKQMNSLKEPAVFYGKLPKTVFMETEIIPIAIYQRFQKYFEFSKVNSVDSQVAHVRTIKSTYELNLMEKSGQIHKRILEDRVPKLLHEGMSEIDLVGELFSVMLEEGHHGVARFGMFDTEMGLGQIGFGDSSIYPTYFNGPGGNFGISPAVPLFGSRDRKLNKGDLVFVDIGCGFEGYHTDKTLTYMFGKALPEEAIEIHHKCVSIQNEIAQMLKPGNIPSQIYNTIMSKLDKDFLENFMGFGDRKAKFLGHGIGLIIDELPVIAEGFNEPLEEGMVFALEPKKGIKNIGMVGIENTFFVTPNGGKCITGDNPGLISVY